MEFVTPLTVVPKKLQATHKKWQKLAKSWDYSGPVAWRVKAGFTLKKHAPLVGPCYERFAYLQDWQFEDEPTTDSIVFWIPRLVPESTSKNVDEQRELLSALRTRLELPEHHLNGFGSVALVAGLILAHFKRVGETVPLDRLWVRTDTRDSGGYRLNLGYFDGCGLYCNGWVFGGRRGDGLGAFALGVELDHLGTRPNTSVTRFACPHCSHELK